MYVHTPNMAVAYTVLDVFVIYGVYGLYAFLVRFAFRRRKAYRLIIFDYFIYNIHNLIFPCIFLKVPLATSIHANGTGNTKGV